MNEYFFRQYQAKLKVMQAHAKSLNLFLEMEFVALRGNESLKEGITYITDRLPECHKQKSVKYPIQSFLISQTFVSLVSEFETFLVDTMATIIKRHPKKLGSEAFKLSEIIEIKDINELTRIAAERFINGVMYKRANEYRKSLVDILSADEDFLLDKWPRYVECKARRDIGVHNGWLINETYRRKLSEVGMPSPESGYANPSNDYFWDVLTLLSDLTTDIVDHCMEKFGNQ